MTRRIHHAARRWGLSRALSVFLFFWSLPPAFPSHILYHDVIWVHVTYTTVTAYEEKICEFSSVNLARYWTTRQLVVNYYTYRYSLFVYCCSLYSISSTLVRVCKIIHLSSTVTIIIIYNILNKKWNCL